MKKFFLLCFMLSMHIHAYSQTTLFCGTPSNQNNLSSTEQKRLTEFYNQSNEKTSGGAATNSTSSSIPNDETIVIPVVVHVIHSGGAVGSGTNISDDQICSQINVLNEDFSRMNPDRVNTPGPFANVASNPKVQFYLATRDPSGNPTNGITRTQTTRTTFSDNNDIKSNATGGHDPWDANNYLNIWVSGPPVFNSQGQQLAGYAQFPWDLASRPTTDGVVIFNQTFGRGNFNLATGYTLGHTTSHEVGHWMALLHIWGDDNGACNGSDGISDTPNQAGNSTGNPSFPRYDACNTDFPGVMFMNYMDYSLDDSRNMFTALQATMMRLVFGPNQYRQYASYALGRPIVGSEPVCSSSTFSIPSLPVGLNIIGWSSDNTNGLTIDNNGLATRQNGFSGLVTITATVNSGCSFLTLTKVINVGPPYINSVMIDNATSSGPVAAYSGSTHYIQASASNALGTSYSFSTSTNNGDISFNLSGINGGNCQVYVSGSTGYGAVIITATNACGSSTSQVIFYIPSGYRVASNPAKDNTTVIFDDTSYQEALPDEIDLLSEKSTAPVRTINVQEMASRKSFSNGNAVEINVADLPRGTYYLHIKNSRREDQKVDIIRLLLE